MTNSRAERYRALFHPVDRDPLRLRRGGRVLPLIVIGLSALLAFPLYIGLFFMAWTVPTLVIWFLIPTTLVLLALVGIVLVFGPTGARSWAWRLTAIFALCCACALFTIPQIISAQWAASMRGPWSP